MLVKMLNHPFIIKTSVSIHDWVLHDRHLIPSLCRTFYGFQLIIIIIKAWLPPHSVDVRFDSGREVKVDDVSDILEIDPSRHAILSAFTLRWFGSDERNNELWGSWPNTDNGDHQERERTTWESQEDGAYFFCFFFPVAFLPVARELSSEAMTMSYRPVLNCSTMWLLVLTGSSEFRAQDAIENCSKNSFNLQNKDACLWIMNSSHRSWETPGGVQSGKLLKTLFERKDSILTPVFCTTCHLHLKELDLVTTSTG